MQQRALVIGSQTGALVGVHADVEVVTDVLQGLGFAVDARIEGRATRAGILEGYRALIDESKADDAAVVYYSGHGNRQRNAKAASDPDLPTWMQYIVPTDIDDRRLGFNGILAQELSALQVELTGKTPNVTTILDCCHSARMSRDPEIVPKADAALAPFPWSDLEARWTAAAVAVAASDVGDSNALAVRLVASAPEESAFEMRETAIGGPHGLLTSRLVLLLRTAAAQQGALTWREVLDSIRPGVMDTVAAQRPEVEGPFDRFLFRLTTRETTGVLPVVVSGGQAWLDDAGLFGLAPGDRYAIVAPGVDPATAGPTAVVAEVVAGRARLELTGIVAGEVVVGTAAYPREVTLGARPVRVEPPDHPGRPAVVAAIGGSTRLRIVDAGEQVDALATVRLGDGTVQLLDGSGVALSAPAPVATSLEAAAKGLERLARASHLRDLPSGTGDEALPDDVELAFERLLPDGALAPLAGTGEHLFSGDRIVIRARNGSTEQRYVSVLDVGIAAAISLQTRSQPAGVVLAAGEGYDVGRDVAGNLTGLELWWPDTVAAETSPRAESYVVVVSDAPVSNLARLEQEGVGTQRSSGAGQRSALDLLVDDLVVGRRDSRPEAAAPTRRVRFRVTRFDFTLHHDTRPDAEPRFEVDERPDPSFRLVEPIARGVVPTHASVRLGQVVVHSNHAIFKAKVRLDALVLTAPRRRGAPYRAETARFARVGDESTLSLANWLVYDGPVGRFLDIAVWLAKDEDGPDLAQLLEQEAGDEKVQGAIGTLAGLALAAPHAALGVAAVGAVGALVGTASRLLKAAQGTAIGVYRTSFLPHEAFGSGDGVGRHPTTGLTRASDMSFALEVIDPDRA